MRQLFRADYLSANTLKRLSERGWFADSSDDGAANPARATHSTSTKHMISRENLA